MFGRKRSEHDFGEEWSPTYNLKLNAFAGKGLATGRLEPPLSAPLGM
jgi:hypothetical protein